MENLMEEYAKILLKECLKLKKGEPLYIMGPMERYDFIRLIVEYAYKMGTKDVYLDLKDGYMKHSQAKYLTEEELKNDAWWQGKKVEEYAKKNAAFLSLTAVYPDLMSDIDAEKLANMQLFATKQSPTFDKKRNQNELSWCIAAVPTQDWADKLFPGVKNNLAKLWKTILDICSISQENPKKAILEKVKQSHQKAEKLNNLNLKYLKYQNSLGTDLTIELPKNYVFNNIEMELADGRIIYPNMPSEEVYSSPKRNGTEGIVYASKPLIHNGKLIEDFYLEFHKGKVVNFGAKKGKKDLEKIINFDSNSMYLGEVALVDYNSPISKTNILFYTTLFDENASCHIALGQAFSDCIKDGKNKKPDELKKLGLNQSKTHVDFMIGTKDLEIKGITEDNQEIIIFHKGNCVL